MCYNTSAISINVSACTVYKNVKDNLISSEILKQTIQGATKHRCNSNVNLACNKQFSTDMNFPSHFSDMCLIFGLFSKISATAVKFVDIFTFSRFSRPEVDLLLLTSSSEAIN